jgi:predicted acetyltransferase
MIGDDFVIKKEKKRGTGKAVFSQIRRDKYI